MTMLGQSPCRALMRRRFFAGGLAWLVVLLIVRVQRGNSSFVGDRRHLNARALISSRSATADDELRAKIAGMRAREIKAELSDSGVDTSDLFDKEDLANRLFELQSGTSDGAPTPSPANSEAGVAEESTEEEKSPEDFMAQCRAMTVKALRTELGTRNIKWADALDKEDLVERLAKVLAEEASVAAKGPLRPGEVTKITGPQLRRSLHAYMYMYISSTPSQDKRCEAELTSLGLLASYRKPAMARQFRLGDRVTVAQTQLCGTVKFIGTTEFAAGEWMGIELDEKQGKNNGSVKGKTYFDCKPEHGLFVRPTAVTKISQPVPEISLQTPQAPEPPPQKDPQPPAASVPKAPVQPALLAIPQSGATPPPRRISKMEEGDKTREVEKASVQLELAQAMEDHDVDAIRSLIPRAANLCLAPEEISAARRILSWEVKQNMREEVDAVCNSVLQLKESIGNFMEEVQATKRPKTDSGAVISRLGVELEKRVWQKLESKIDGIVEKALAKLPEPPRPLELSLEAFCFEHFDLNGDGIITRDEFEEARQKILAQGGKTPAPAIARISDKITEKDRRLTTPREKVPWEFMRNLYTLAAQRLEVMEEGPVRDPSSEIFEASRFVVQHVLRKGIQRAQLMGAGPSVPDALAEAQQDIAAIRASKRRIEDATRKAEERVNAASTKVQAVARGRQARQKKDLLEKSAVTLQRSLRRLRQQWHQGKRMDFAAVVRAVKGQRREWAMEFQRVAGEDGLDQQSFVEALTRACGESVSSLQAEKLWIGYEQQSTGLGPMVLATFWAICEAVHEGDVVAAEFADITVEEYASYGHVPNQRAQLMGAGPSVPDALAEAQQDIAAIRASKRRIEDATRKAEERVNAASTKVQAVARGRQARQKKDLLEKSAVTLQRSLRRLRQQWHQGKRMDFAAVVRAVKGQRREWAMEFQRVAGEDGLDQQSFVEALTRACGESVSSLQAEKLWLGYLQQSELSGSMVLATFWAICEAVSQGDVQAAEFADMTVEEYVSYGTAESSADRELQAAQRIQAAHLGRKTRLQDRPVMVPAEALEQAAARLQAAHLGRLLRQSAAEAPPSQNPGLA
ncbi:CLIP1 [Symbiodinium microadriaticum]|nr:CLIP1 [Symbiodinium microadriaticum]